MSNHFEQRKAQADYHLREGDTGPAIEDVLKNLDGSAVDLSDADAVRIGIRNQADGDLVVNTEVDNFENDGTVTHEFSGGFATTEAGMHEVFWRVEFSSGAVESYPRGGVAYLWVPEDWTDGDTADLDAANASVGILTVEDHIDMGGNDIQNAGAIGATTTTTERIGSGPLFSGSFSGADADARLDSALSEVSTGDWLILEPTAGYSDDRTISTDIRISGPYTESRAAAGVSVTGVWTIADTCTIEHVEIRDPGELHVDGQRTIVFNVGLTGSSTTPLDIAADGVLLTMINGPGDVTFEAGTSNGEIGVTGGRTTVTDNGTNNIL